MAENTPKLIYKGNRVNLPEVREVNSFYLCEDTRELYFGPNLFTGAVRFYTADKPLNPAQGVLYLNTTTGAGDAWNGNGWVSVVKGFVTAIEDDADDTTVPTTKATKDYTDSKVTEVVTKSFNSLGSLATKNEVSEEELATALKEKIDAKADQDSVASLNNKVTATKEKINSLIGEDDGKSIRNIANEELVTQLIPEAAKESMDTLAEIAAWIQAHPDDAAAMNQAITTLQANVGTLPNDLEAAIIRITNLEGRTTDLEGTITVGTF